MQIAQFIPIFILGFALAVVYHTTGKIWLAMLLHAANNSIQVLALMQQKEFAWGGWWIVLPFLFALFLYRAISTRQKTSK
jgi:membrane protease YdiL (CAAX protease family)